jgi:uncharacterized membrane protein YeaQ/YmgE (transglycosylase-associated protein family)
VYIGTNKHRRDSVNILVWIIVGLVAGWLASLIMKGHGMGLVGNLVLGLLGGVVGGWVFGLLGLGATGIPGQILVSAVGAVILIVVVRALRRV